MGEFQNWSILAVKADVCMSNFEFNHDGIAARLLKGRDAKIPGTVPFADDNHINQEENIAEDDYYCEYSSYFREASPKDITDWMAKQLKEELTENYKEIL